jgi:23S rRNA (guanine745-N1)-methyltransferase
MDGGALAAVVPALRCPVCADPLRLDSAHLDSANLNSANLDSAHLNSARLVCDRGHSFDLARQGYVSLTSGRAGPGTGDSAAVVAARERFLAEGHYQPLAAALATLAARHAGARAAGARPDDQPPGLVLDLAGGTGYYLARVLAEVRERYGACVDLSAPALRRAARAHPRAAAIGADAWQPLPFADDSAAVIMSVFGPRNAAEISRVLAPGGTLLIATPGPGHLHELRGPLGMIGIDEQKAQRLAGAYGEDTLADVVPLGYELSLDHPALTALVEMGPSARHVSPAELATRLTALPAAVTVTVDLEIRVYRAGHRG